ncbi:MAG: hypothetical protein MHM6MM_007050 [Cercozoa sp. M6MM]
MADYADVFVKIVNSCKNVFESQSMFRVNQETLKTLAVAALAETPPRAELPLRLSEEETCNVKFLQYLLQFGSAWRRKLLEEGDAVTRDRGLDFTLTAGILGFVMTKQGAVTADTMSQTTLTEVSELFALPLQVERALEEMRGAVTLSEKSALEPLAREIHLAILYAASQLRALELPSFAAFVQNNSVQQLVHRLMRYFPKLFADVYVDDESNTETWLCAKALLLAREVTTHQEEQADKAPVAVNDKVVAALLHHGVVDFVDDSADIADHDYDRVLRCVCSHACQLMLESEESLTTSQLQLWLEHTATLRKQPAEQQEVNATDNVPATEQIVNLPEYTLRAHSLFY